MIAMPRSIAEAKDLASGWVASNARAAKARDEATRLYNRIPAGPIALTVGIVAALVFLFLTIIIESIGHPYLWVRLVRSCSGLLAITLCWRSRTLLVRAYNSLPTGQLAVALGVLSALAFGFLLGTIDACYHGLWCTPFLWVSMACPIFAMTTVVLCIRSHTFETVVLRAALALLLLSVSDVAFSIALRVYDAPVIPWFLGAICGSMLVSSDEWRDRFGNDLDGKVLITVACLVWGNLALIALNPKPALNQIIIFWEIVWLSPFLLRRLYLLARMQGELGYYWEYDGKEYKKVWIGNPNHRRAGTDIPASSYYEQVPDWEHGGQKWELRVTGNPGKPPPRPNHPPRTETHDVFDAQVGWHIREVPKGNPDIPQPKPEPPKDGLGSARKLTATDLKKAGMLKGKDQ